MSYHNQFFTQLKKQNKDGFIFTGASNKNNKNNITKNIALCVPQYTNFMCQVLKLL